MVGSPADYRWSSHACNALGETNPLIHHYACYLALASNEAERQAVYRGLVQAACDEDASRFSHHLHRQHPMGNDRFRAAIEAQLGRSVSPRKGGRPKKQRPELEETRL
jgi:putative transposase